MSKSIDGINIVDTSGPEYVKQEFFKDCEEVLLGVDNKMFNKLLRQKVVSVNENDLSGVTRLNPYVFYGCDLLKEIDFPERLTRVGYACFAYCSALKEVTLPSTIKVIEANAFVGCGANTSSKFTFSIKAQTPPTLNSPLIETQNLNKIVVPQGTLEAYKAATNWSTYADYMEESTEW